MRRCSHGRLLQLTCSGGELSHPSLKHWPQPRNLQLWNVSKSHCYFRSTKRPAVLGVPSVGGREGGEGKPTDSSASESRNRPEEYRSEKDRRESDKGCHRESSSRSWKGQAGTECSGTGDRDAGRRGGGYIWLWRTLLMDGEKPLQLPGQWDTLRPLYGRHLGDK